MSEDLRRFQLHRTTDISGVSGTGIVADGVVFPSGTVALCWRGEWPTSVVFHDRGIESVQHIHGHGGATRIVWLDMVGGPPAPAMGLDEMWTTLTAYVREATRNPMVSDASQILALMTELKAQRVKPIGDWIRSFDDPEGEPKPADPTPAPTA